MKMESAIGAPAAGTVTSVLCAIGDREAEDAGDARGLA